LGQPELEAQLARASAQDQQAVQGAGGEGMEVAQPLGQSRLAAEDAPQVVVRGAPRRAAGSKEEPGDRPQQQARQAAPEMAADPGDQPEPERRAALGLGLPAALLARIHALAPNSICPWAATPAAVAQLNRSPPAARAVKETRTASPGRTGRVNFTILISRSGPSSGRSSRSTAQLSSSRTTAGTIGSPGKCPGRQGWPAGTVKPPSRAWTMVMRGAAPAAWHAAACQLRCAAGGPPAAAGAAGRPGRRCGAAPRGSAPRPAPAPPPGRRVAAPRRRPPGRAGTPRRPRRPGSPAGGG